MPAVVCPSCQKKYKLPDTAVGKTASCACGTRFKVNAASQPASSAASASRPEKRSVPAASRPAKAPVAAASIAAPPVTKKAPSPKAAPAVAAPKDDFWEEALNEPVRLAEPVTPAKPASYSYFEEAKEEKRQKKKRVVWGADWAKVGGGLMTFLIAGGITVGLVVATGYLYFFPAIIAGGGLLTCLSGLMGKEGVW